MDGLPDRVVAPEREGHVGDAAADEHTRQLRLDATGRVDVGHRVAVVLLDAGADGEDVGIEDDVRGVEAGLLREQGVDPVRDADPLLHGLRLTLLVEGHDHHGRAVATSEPRLAQELRLALLERQGVDDGPALDALETRLDDRPLGGIDHHRHPADIRLRGDEVEVARHRRLGIEQRLVHVDVDDLGAAVDLLSRDLDGLLVSTVRDELGEAPRAGDVGPLADVHEQRNRA